MLKGVPRKDLVGVIQLEDEDNVIVIRQNSWKGLDRVDIRLFWHPSAEPEGL